MYVEYDAIPAATSRLCELHPEEFAPLDALGIAVIDAGAESQIAPLAEYFRALGKNVYAVFDGQSPESRAAITAATDDVFECPEKGFEALIVNHSGESALRRFALAVVAAGRWPPHMAASAPSPTMPADKLRAALRAFFIDKKGEGAAAEFLVQCDRSEMPAFIVRTALRMREIVWPAQASVSHAQGEQAPGAESPTSPA
jgi:putative ATP-dependent endonuclease of OLD family